MQFTTNLRNCSMVLNGFGVHSTILIMKTFGVHRIVALWPENEGIVVSYPLIAQQGNPVVIVPYCGF